MSVEQKYDSSAFLPWCSQSRSAPSAHLLNRQIATRLTIAMKAVAQSAIDQAALSGRIAPRPTEMMQRILTIIALLSMPRRYLMLPSAYV